MDQYPIKTLSIVIPVYNERKTVIELLRRVARVPLKGIRKEIIVIDDCSNDGTRELLEKAKNRLTNEQNPALFLTEFRENAAGGNPEFKFLFKDKNEGKGAAVGFGLRVARGDVTLIQDADFEYHPEEYPLLLKPFIYHDAQVVYGSRFVTSAPHRVLYYHHYLANRFVTFLSNLFTNFNISDMETCYKVFRKDIKDKITPHLQSKRFGIEPELTALISKAKARVYEVGISYSGRTYEDGKKLNWKDGIAAVWHVLYHNLFRKVRFQKAHAAVSKNDFSSIPVPEPIYSVLSVSLAKFAQKEPRRKFLSQVSLFSPALRLFGIIAVILMAWVLLITLYF